MLLKKGMYFLVTSFCIIWLAVQADVFMCFNPRIIRTAHGLKSSYVFQTFCIKMLLEYY